MSLAVPLWHLVGTFEGPLAGIWGTTGGSWLGCCLLLMLELRLLQLLLKLRLLLILKVLHLRLQRWLLQLCWRSHSGSIVLLRLWGRRGILLLRRPRLLCCQLLLRKLLLSMLRLLWRHLLLPWDVRLRCASTEWRCIHPLRRSCCQVTRLQLRRICSRLCSIVNA